MNLTFVCSQNMCAASFRALRRRWSRPKWPKKLKDARVAVHGSRKSLNTRLEIQEGADATQSVDPPLPMLQFDEP